MEALLEGIVAFYLRHPGWFRLDLPIDGCHHRCQAVRACLPVQLVSIGHVVVEIGMRTAEFASDWRKLTSRTPPRRSIKSNAAARTTSRLSAMSVRILHYHR